MRPLSLKVDTALLRAIVESNPELMLEIGTAVQKNISDDVVKVAIMEKLKAQLDQIAAFADGWNRRGSMINPFHNSPLHDLLKRLINAQIEQATEELIIESVTPVIDKVFASKLEAFQEQIDSTIAASFTPEHIQEQMNKRMAEMFAKG